MTDDPFVARLAAEVTEWRREGVVDAPTTRRIRQRYGIQHQADEGEDAGGQGRAVTVIGTLGSILVGLGVILFVASNWEAIGRPGKLALLLAFLVAFSGVAFLLRGHGHPRIGSALVFCSQLVFGANIFLIGQIYHVRSSEPTFLLIWAVGMIPMAYVARSRLTAFVSILALLGWYAMLLSDWGALSGPHPLVAPSFLAFGLALVGFGGVFAAFQRTEPFAVVTRVVGLATAFFVVFLLTFVEVWRSAGHAASTGQPPVTAFVVTAVLVLVAAVVANLASALWSRSGSLAWIEMIGSVCLVAITLVMVLVAPFGSPEPYALLFHVVALGAVIWAVLLGVATGRESLVNLSLVLFGLVVMARYFDFFGTLSNKSIGFIGAGVLLLVGGFVLERSRRFLLAQSHSLEVSNAN